MLSVPREDTLRRILAAIGVTYLAVTIAVVNFFLWRQILDLWKESTPVILDISGVGGCRRRR